MAYRTCEECQRWFYDPKTGLRSTRFGEPYPRLPADPRPNCRDCAKCRELPREKQNPAEGAKRTLSAKNWRTLEFYHEVQASRIPVHDALTIRNLGMIARVFSDHERLTGHRLSAVLQVLANRR